MTASQVRHKSQTLLYENNIRQFAALTVLETVGYFSCRTVFGIYLLQQLINVTIRKLSFCPWKFTRYARWRRLESLYKEVFRVSRCKSCARGRSQRSLLNSLRSIKCDLLFIVYRTRSERDRISLSWISIIFYLFYKQLNTVRQEPEPRGAGSAPKEPEP